MVYGLAVLDRGAPENGSTQQDPSPCTKTESTAGPDGLAACEGDRIELPCDLAAPTVELGPPDLDRTTDSPLPRDPQEACDRKPSKAWPSIPSYEILDVIREGGMGVVYLARQRGLNRLVALKMIRGDRARPDHFARFRIEAEAVAHLRHPNIIQIHEIGETEGLPYLSLELMDGGTLEDRLSATPQPGRQAAALLATLARAVQVAHSAGIIHRDLKPSNVLFTEEDVPKVTDFGLAKRLDSDSRQTETGQIMGTPCYMAPEQAKGHTRDVGPAADVYALGSMLYEMLTGRPPFKGETPIETVRQVVEGREAAALVALSLGGEIAAQPGPEAPPTPVVAQLVPVQESSLAIVGTLLIVTLPSSTSEVNLEPAETEATTVASVSSAAPVGVGQGLTMQGHGDDAVDDDEQDTKPEEAKAAVEVPDAAPWKRFMMDTDEALERFNREHSELFPARRNDVPESNPTEGHSKMQAPAQENPPAPCDWKRLTARSSIWPFAGWVKSTRNLIV